MSSLFFTVTLLLAQTESSRTAHRIDDVLTAFTGRVLDEEGRPAAFVAVRTSAGGEAVTDPRGEFWLDVSLPATTRRVRVFAKRDEGDEHGAAAAWVPLAAGGGIHPLEDLHLSTSCTPQWVPTFGAAPGTAEPDDDVEALYVFDDGGGSGPELYAGGHFGEMSGISATNIARWNGATWSAVGSGLGGVSKDVLCLASFDSGNGAALYAGGTFTVASGGPANYLARWDGSSWAPVPGGVNNVVSTLFTTDDGGGPALFLGGTFTSAGGAPAAHIARWNGASWSDLGGGTSGTIDALVAYDDGTGSALYAAGGFTSIGGVAATRIARWNGTSWSPLGSGLNGFCRGAKVWDDGLGGGPALYVCGTFSMAGGIAAGGIARWNGTSWSAVGTVSGSSLYDLAVFDDGSGPALFTAGDFLFGGVTLQKTAKWNGTSWTFKNANNYTYAFAVYDDGNGPDLFRAGVFFSPSHQIARWDGTDWAPVGGTGPNSGVDALAAYDDGSGAGPALFAAGSFTHMGEQRVNYIARWDGTGGSRLGDGLRGEVRALEVFDAGSGPELYASSGFVGGGASNLISRWNGASWSDASSGMPSATISALLSFDDGSGPALFAGGGTFSAGTWRAYVGRWNGTSWTTISGFWTNNSFVRALCSYDDGSGGGPTLVAGGEFRISTPQVEGNAVATWDGTSWTPLPGFRRGGIQALGAFDDGNGPALYAGGLFTQADGDPGDYIARWDGSAWSSLEPGGTNGQIYALRAMDDGSGPALYVGGWFDHAGGQPTNGLARWDGSSWSPMSTGTSVGALLDGDALGRPTALLAGGVFLRSIGSGDGYLALWEGCDTLPPVLSLPPFVVAKDPFPGPRGEIVNFMVTASDNTDPAPAVVCVPPSGSFFQQGTTQVTCTASDAAGNSSTGSFLVFVGKARQR